MRDGFSRRETLAGAAAFGVAGRVSAQGRESPVASTVYGRVRGEWDGGIAVFRGVRYGADTSTRRFMPALPPRRWAGIAAATAYGPASPQSRAGERTSEDCLLLNVWTPAVGDARRRPVMVYVHGGAHAHGSGSDPLYDGTRLARRGDVVVVTLNHRLNVFGYGYFGRLGDASFADSGNVGNLDLILALQWVRDNSRAFGGEPGNVTLFGQSGGGGKIVTLMAMPAASGLYHRVATMSGQHVTAAGPINATTRAKAYLGALGLKPEQVGRLRTLPVERLVEALDTVDPLLGKGEISFVSTLDQRSLSRHPFYPDAPRESAHIPMIIGNTHDETAAWLGDVLKARTLTWDELPDRLAREMVVDILPEYVIARYRSWYPWMGPTDVLLAASTAGRSWRGHLIQAEGRAQIGAPAFMYQLDFRSPAEGGRLGAFHTLDIPLVFDNVDKPGSKTGTDSRAHRMAEIMSAAFVAFARSGDPNNAAIPHWRKYELARRSTMIFDLPPRMEDDPRGNERRLFATVPYNKPGG